MERGAAELSIQQSLLEEKETSRRRVVSILMVSRRASTYKLPCVRHGPLGLHGRLAHVVLLGVRQLQVVLHVPRVASNVLLSGCRPEWTQFTVA